jgi:hypothetical protein
MLLPVLWVDVQFPQILTTGFVQADKDLWNIQDEHQFTGRRVASVMALAFQAALLLSSGYP